MKNFKYFGKYFELENRFSKYLNRFSNKYIGTTLFQSNTKITVHKHKNILFFLNISMSWIHKLLYNINSKSIEKNLKYIEK